MSQRAIKIGWAVFIIFIMVFSTIGFIYNGNSAGETSEKQTFRGREVVMANGQWNIELSDGSYLPVGYDPEFLEELEYIEPDKSKGKIYVAYEPKDDVSLVKTHVERISTILGYQNPIFVQKSCLYEENCTENIPIVGCSDNKSVVLVKTGDDAKMYEKESCVVMEGDNVGLDQLTERLLIEEIL